MSACSTYDKKVTLPKKHKRAVYAADTSIDDVDYHFDDVPDGKYDVFQVDTEVADIMAFTTDTKRFGKQQQGGPKASSSRVPREEWNKMTQEQRNKVIAKIRQEQQANNDGKPKTSYPQRQANVHDVNDVVDDNDIIDYAVMSHDVHYAEEGDDPKDSADCNDQLLT